MASLHDAAKGTEIAVALLLELVEEGEQLAGRQA